jgi:hypothetical protein
VVDGPELPFTRYSHATARPVEPAIRALWSILMFETSVYGMSVSFKPNATILRAKNGHERLFLHPANVARN